MTEAKWRAAEFEGIWVVVRSCSYRLEGMELYDETFIDEWHAQSRADQLNLEEG